MSGLRANRGQAGRGEACRRNDPLCAGGRLGPPAGSARQCDDAPPDPCGPRPSSRPERAMVHRFVPVGVIVLLLSGVVALAARSTTAQELVKKAGESVFTDATPVD